MKKRLCIISQKVAKCLLFEAEESSGDGDDEVVYLSSVNSVEAFQKEIIQEALSDEEFEVILGNKNYKWNDWVLLKFETKKVDETFCRGNSKFK